MMKRYELHNHTLESDAGISCAELVSVMEKDSVDVFALTDHNTVSGHGKIRQILESEKHNVRCIYGMEYTTYYGHILCQNLNRYGPWNEINRHRPELLFKACREAGAIVGIAHPFAFGDPFARGCRFEMNITDYSFVDYIEIINNQESMSEVNSHGIAWWESLVLSGKKIAATAGMDLHRDSGFAMKFATYIDGTMDGDPAAELEKAVRSGRTWVSDGIVLHAEKTADNRWSFSLEDVKKKGFVPFGSYVMTLKSECEEKQYDITSDGLVLTDAELPQGNVIIPKLYGESVDLKNLVCVSPVIYR